VDFAIEITFSSTDPDITRVTKPCKDMTGRDVYIHKGDIMLRGLAYRVLKIVEDGLGTTVITLPNSSLRWNRAGSRDMIFG